MERRSDTVPRQSRQALRRPAAILGVAGLLIVYLLIILGRSGDGVRDSDTDSISAAVRVCDRRIDSLLTLGDRDDDTGDLRHLEAAGVLRCRDSLIAAAGCAPDTSAANRVVRALERDTAILNAKITLFADMPRLHADLLARLQRSRQALDNISHRK